MYLTDKLLYHSKSSNSSLKRLMDLMYANQRQCRYSDSLLSHSQEEADTLLILHALTVPRDADVVVFSLDTDVL